MRHRENSCRGAGLIAFAAFVLAAGALAGESSPDQVVVVANRNVPESLELARYYIKARHIPPGRLCALDLPKKEAMSRRAYNERLRDPLLAFLREAELIEQEPREPREVRAYETAWTTSAASIRYLVSMYGVPLKITDTKTKLGGKIATHMGKPQVNNSAAVDSELALLLMPPYDIKGSVACPLYGRLALSQDGANQRHFLIAARLDGPDPDVVRRMIDDSLAAEHYGLLGRGLFDSRGLTSDAYMMGDYWVEDAYERFRREGYECALDTVGALWSAVSPVDDVALYFGWYAEHAAGPFMREGFRFEPGAIAYHIHSASATTLRSRSKYWAGPLLAAGACATMGAVNEPFLFFTPHLNLFADRICRGFTFGESAYMSLQSASWQVTIVGDPLYRPFTYGLEQQIRHLEEDGKPEVEWAYLRKVNLLVAEGRFNLALDFCRQMIGKTDSLVLREKLAALYAANDLLAPAAAACEAVLQRTASAEQALRVGVQCQRILRRLGQGKKADAIEEELRTRWRDSALYPWLEAIGQ